MGAAMNHVSPRASDWTLARSLFFMGRARWVSMALVAAGISILATVPGAHAAAGPQEGGPPPPSPVRAVRAVDRELVPRHLVTGSLRSAYEAEVSSREAGALIAIDAREGTSWRKGDVIARIDDVRLAAARLMVGARLKEAEASMLSAEAEAADAAADLASLEAVTAKDGVSERELRAARTRASVSAAMRDAAGARAKALMAEMQLMEVRLNDTRICAPFDGTVVERHVEVGEWVAEGAPVVTLVSTTEFELRLDVPERLLTGSEAFGDELTFKLGASGREIRARDVRSVPRVNPKTRTFRVLASVAGEGLGLGTGMSVAAYLPGGPPAAALVVPKDALVYRPGGVTVTVVKGKDEGGMNLTGAAVSLPVSIAYELEREVVLEPGPIAAGDVVIVEGNERLFPGATVAASIIAPKTTDSATGSPAPSEDQR